MNVRGISLTVIAVVLTLLGTVIYGGGLFIAATFGSSPWGLLAFVPVIGQIYLILLSWEAAETFFNFYTIAIFILVCLLLLLFAIITRTNSLAK
jgi:hypothetical protein